MNATNERRSGYRLASLAACLVFAGTALGLTGCGYPVQLRGNTLDPTEIAEIKPGVQSRQDVIDLLGSPSTVSTFQDSKWYYIGQKTQEVAFMKPQVLDRHVLVITFDDAGMVKSTKTYSMADAKDISPVARVTPTEGRDLTLLQQLFGDIGKFSGPKK